MRSPLLDTLTPRRRQTLLLAVGGMSNKEIASYLSLNISTVIAHLNGAYSQLGIEGVTKGKRNKAMAMMREYRG